MEFKNTRSQDSSGFKEREQTPKVNILFRGYNHSSYNLQGVKNIVTDVESFFRQSLGRNIVFLEGSNFTPEKRGRMMSLIVEKKHGIAGALLYTRLLAKLHRAPSEKELREYAQKISEDDFNFSKVPAEEYPNGSPSQYFLAQGLDRLGQQYDYDLMIESHTPEAIRGYEELDRISGDRELEALERMAVADFSGGLEKHKQAVHVMVLSVKGREREILNELSQLVKSSRRQKSNSSIVTIFGGAHAPMIDLLKGRFRKDSSVQCKTQLWGDEDSLDTQIIGKERNGELISDEMYAQHLLAHHISVDLKNDFSKRGLVSRFANNYEDTLAVIDRVVRSLSIEEIKGFYEGKQPVLPILLAHPLAESIKSLIT